MSNAFDDDAAALADIVNSPDISKGEGLTEAVKAPKAETQGGNQPPIHDPIDDRNARIFSRSTSKAFKAFTGSEMEKDSAELTADFSSVIFSGIRQLGLPTWAYMSILIGVIFTPWVPVAFKILHTPKKQGE